jgi:nicotinic acetylcholine receptor, invertebrate
MKNEILLACFFINCIFTCHGGQLGKLEAKRQNLIEYLIRDYQSGIIPGSPVNVSFSYAITQIDSIDQKSQNMISSGYVTQTWYDPRLNWASISNYSEIKSITIQAIQIWIPDTIIVNIGSGDLFISSTINPYYYATVWMDGLVLLYLPVVKLETKCNIITKTFPFDKQTCSVRFASFSNSKNFIDYNQTYPTISYSNIVKNPIWELENIDIEVNEENYEDGSYQSINFSFNLKRKPLYYMLSGILPCFILNGLSIFSFFLTHSDQINLSMACFLTLTVNALLISNEIPVQSDYVPYITIYLIVSMIIPLIAIVWFIIFESIKGKEKMPSWLNCLSHNCLKRISKKYKFMLENDKEAIGFRFKFLNYIIACLFVFCLIIIQMIIWIEISK